MKNSSFCTVSNYTVEAGGKRFDSFFRPGKLHFGLDEYSYSGSLYLVLEYDTDGLGYLPISGTGGKSPRRIAELLLYYGP